ncbi:MAG: FAD:protein FMN transferase [Blautia wexlerae]
MDTVVSETLYTQQVRISRTELDFCIKRCGRQTGSPGQTKDLRSIRSIRMQEAHQRSHLTRQPDTCFRQVLDCLKASGGAMDPTMGRVIRLWDIDGENPHIPSDDELNSLLEDVGYDKVTLDGDQVTMPEGVTLDLGAVGKGIGCDASKSHSGYRIKMYQVLIVNLGGSSVDELRSETGRLCLAGSCH